MKFQLKSWITATTLAMTAAASVALPATTVSWVQQTATVSATNSIEVWVRLAVDPSADRALVVDGSTISFSPEDIGDYVPDTVGGGSNFECSGDLIYCLMNRASWDWKSGGANSFLPDQPVTITPGESHDFLAAIFSPKNGIAAPGVYWVGDVSLGLNLFKENADGTAAYKDFDLGHTCADQAASCSFTRQVLAVPEPAGSALMAIGLGLLGLVSRRRRS
ncbi:MAG TPA: PEP-CTERM sorting domain-containing protein [Burkholderiaceae bacterium]|jgi:hypothetical protein